MMPGTLTGDGYKIHSCDQVGASDVCSATYPSLGGYRWAYWGAMRSRSTT